MKYEKVRFCTDLPTKSQPELGKILVTGATGYIGGRLVPELLERGYKVRIMVRSTFPGIEERWPGVEVVYADARDLESLLKALEGIHTAYYLIHSLQLGYKKFESADIQAAVNFRIAAENQDIQRIIYLCGLGNAQTNLSTHLANRIKVAKKLSEGKIPVTALRAAMIIGSGSASYEILENLIRNAPVFFIPYWAKTKNQPISIRDVIKYLVGVLEIPGTKGKTFDIGGSNVTTYDEMLKTIAEIQGKKRFFFPSPFSWTPLYGYIASLLTPVPGPITKVLMEGCKNEVVCQNNDIKEYLNFEPLSYHEALLRATTLEQDDNIATRWSDAYPPEHELAAKLHQIKPLPRYTSSYCLLSYKDSKSIFQSFCNIGGKMGWFNSNWMWRLRGFLDRILMGVGSSRGRRSNSSLRPDDVIDFWRVENIVNNKMLLLRAEMKLPGKAWLEFHTDTYEGLNKFTVNAYFQSSGFWGRIYWYSFLPFHMFIFKDLLKQIEKRS
jgi:uncharacterized protein YbjT (DUF2867 family)